MSFCISLEIPPNTGNIIRLCANARARAAPDRIRSGSTSSEAQVRRAGMDYAD